MKPFDQIATKIVKGQEQIIGPIAWSEAGKVTGLHIEPSHTNISVDNGGREPMVIDALVSQYEHLFGRASREVCRDAAASVLSQLRPDQVPSSLVAA